MGILALQDGTIWRGESFGSLAERTGEVVFNTALSGYQEILTDPSYRGQMVVMTAPEIGNTGITLEDDEGRGPQVEAFIVRALSPLASNWRSREPLDAWLGKHGVPGIAGINTRQLTLHLRVHGAMNGVIAAQDDVDPQQLVNRARAWAGLTGKDLVRDATCAHVYEWDEPNQAAWVPRETAGYAANGNQLHEQDTHGQSRPHIAVFDFGVKRNILRRIRSLGCRVTVLPATTRAQDAFALDLDGIVLSNGPGDPEALPYALEATRGVLQRDLPTLGICLGHQLIGLALGARTFKLKFGHHGANQPVRELLTGRVRITAQNHNYAVDPAGLPASATVTERNLNDGTVEALTLSDRDVWAVQYHPEASPGPHDGDDVLRQFVARVRHRTSRVA
jgi:carbamoyl-phosphate synthase small subunit